MKNMLMDMLLDSRDHYLLVQEKIRKRLEELPRGSIQKKRLQRGGDYYYLNYREKKSVKSKYIGKVIPPQLKADLEERRNLLQQLKGVQEGMKILKKLRLKNPHAAK